MSKELYNNDKNNQLYDTRHNQIGTLTTEHMLDLLTYGHSSNDEIIHQQLILTSSIQNNIYFLDTNFYDRDLS